MRSHSTKHRTGFVLALAAVFALTAAAAFAVGFLPRPTPTSIAGATHDAARPTVQTPYESGWARFIVTDIQVRPPKPK
jgi:hypothetical protein